MLALESLFFRLLDEKLFDVFDAELGVDWDGLLLFAFDELFDPLCNEPVFELLTIVVDEADDDVLELPRMLELELLTADVDDNDDAEGDDCCETILAHDLLDADAVTVFEVDALAVGKIVFDDDADELAGVADTAAAAAVPVVVAAA